MALSVDAGSGKRKRRMSGQEPNETNNGANNAEKNKRSPESNTPVPKATAPISDCKSGKTDKKKANWTEVFAFVAAIGGLLAAGFAWYQGWVARDTEIISTRAFIISNSVQYITYQDPSESFRKWDITPIIENTGNTQTVALTTFSKFSIGGIDNTFPWDDPTKQIPRAVRLIGPKTSEFGQSFTTAPDMLKQFQTNNARLGVVGIARYRDIFGRWHLTEYCYLARAMAAVDFQRFPAFQPLKVDGILCDKHNCADEECGGDWEERAKN
jgi:hypothetical protein